MEETTTTYIGFSALDIKGLANQLNAFVEAGGTITSLYLSGDKVVNALVLGAEPAEDSDSDETTEGSESTEGSDSNE